MFCVYCGKELLDHYLYCPDCGKLRIDVESEEPEEHAEATPSFALPAIAEEGAPPSGKEGFFGRLGARFFREKSGTHVERAGDANSGGQALSALRNINELGSLCERQVKESPFRFVGFDVVSQTELTVEVEDDGGRRYLIAVRNVSGGRRGFAPKGFGNTSPTSSLSCEQIVFLRIVDALCKSDPYNLSSSFRENLKFFEANKISRWTPTLIKGDATYVSSEGEVSSYYCTVEMDKAVYEEERRRRGLPGARAIEQPPADRGRCDSLEEGKIASFIDGYLDEMVEAGFESVEFSISADLSAVSLDGIDPYGRKVNFEGRPTEWDYPSFYTKRGDLSLARSLYRNRAPGEKPWINVADDDFLCVLKEFVRAFTRLDWTDPLSLNINTESHGERVMGFIDVAEASSGFEMTCFTGSLDSNRIRFTYSMESSDFKKIKDEILNHPVVLLERGGCTNVSIDYHESKRSLAVSGVSSFGVSFNNSFELRPGEWSRDETYERPAFRINLERFLEAFLRADWEKPEDSLTRAPSLKVHKVVVDKIGYCQFEITIIPGTSSRYIGKIAFEKEAFLSYLNGLREDREREQIAREEAAHQAAIRDEAAEVDAKISAIGAVALYSKEAIAAARAAYGALSEDSRTVVTKLNVLETAEAELAALEAKAKEEEAAIRAAEQAARAERARQAAIREAASNVDSVINAIEDATSDIGAAIVAARAAYEALTEEQKAAVVALHVLEAAEADEEERRRKSTEIEDRAYQRRSDLENVVIPRGITRIGRFAFRGCRELQRIIIPDSVTVIESGAFAGCHELKWIRIPKQVEVIEERVFNGCRSLGKVIMHENLKEIRDGAFLGCVSLKEATMPSSVEKIASNAFDGCPFREGLILSEREFVSVGSAFDDGRWQAALDELDDPVDLHGACRIETHEEWKLEEFDNIVYGSGYYCGWEEYDDGRVHL